MNIESETESDVLRGESIVVGSNPPGVISETENPSHVVFDATDGHDLHLRTQVTLSNPADTQQTERVTVTLSQGDTSTGTVLASTTEEVSLESFAVQTLDFNTEEFRLSPQRYRIDVELAGDAFVPFDIQSVREYTKPVAYTWDSSVGGDLELIHQRGQPSLSIDSETGVVSFPLGIDELTGSRQFGDDPEAEFVNAETFSGTASIADSGGPTAVTFLAGDGVDVHVGTDVTVEDDTGDGTTDDVTVELIHVGMGDGSDEVVASDTQSVSVGAGLSKTVTLLDTSISLGDGEYRVDSSTSGSLPITETAERTHGATYMFERDSDGVLHLTDYNGTQKVSYPYGASAPVEHPAGTRYEPRADPTTDDIPDGQAMTYLADGSGTGSAGDLVYAINDGGTVLTNIISEKSNAS